MEDWDAQLEGRVEDLLQEEATYDGSGSSVFIPTILIDIEDGQKMEELFSSDPAVKL